MNDCGPPVWGRQAMTVVFFSMAADNFEERVRSLYLSELFHVA